jgi:hypothetical protein
MSQKQSFKGFGQAQYYKERGVRLLAHQFNVSNPIDIQYLPYSLNSYYIQFHYHFPGTTSEFDVLLQA